MHDAFRLSRLRSERIDDFVADVALRDAGLRPYEHGDLEEEAQRRRILL